MLPFLQEVITAIVWVIANVVYLDLRRKGVSGFTRFAAFWVGTPTTWITFFVVRDRARVKAGGSHGEVGDGGSLLEEIREDRRLRDPDHPPPETDEV